MTLNDHEPVDPKLRKRVDNHFSKVFLAHLFERARDVYPASGFPDLAPCAAFSKALDLTLQLYKDKGAVINSPEYYRTYAEEGFYHEYLPAQQPLFMKSHNPHLTPDPTNHGFLFRLADLIVEVIPTTLHHGSGYTTPTKTIRYMHRHYRTLADYISEFYPKHNPFSTKGGAL